MSTGTILFSKTVVKAEASGFGTGAAADFSTGGRRLVVGPTGVINLGQEWDLGADKSVAVRNPVLVGRSTLVATAPEISLDATPSTDELAIYLNAVQNATPTGSGPYVWTYNIGMTASATAPKSLQAIVTDGNQSYHVAGILPRTIGLSAGTSGLTTLSFGGFAKSVAKTSQATAEGLPAVTPRNMAGRVWRAYTDTAFPDGAGDTAFDYLYDWKLDISTGSAPIFAQVGGTGAADYNQFGAPFGGQLSLTVASNPAAISTFLDKLGGVVYLRLNWADAGSPQHSVDIRTAVIVSSVQPIAGDQDGVATYAIEAALAYDPTSAKSLEIVVNNSLSAAP